MGGEAELGGRGGEGRFAATRELGRGSGISPPGADQRGVAPALLRPRWDPDVQCAGRPASQGCPALRSKAAHCTHWRSLRGPTVSSPHVAGRPVTHLEAASRRGPRHLAALLSPPLSTPFPDRTQHPPPPMPGSCPFKKPDAARGGRGRRERRGGRCRAALIGPRPGRWPRAPAQCAVARAPGRRERGC